MKKGMGLYDVNKGIFNLKGAKTLNNPNCPQILKVFSFRNGGILNLMLKHKKGNKNVDPKDGETKRHC